MLRRKGVAVMSFPRQQSPALLWRSRVLYPAVRLVKRIVPVGACAARLASPQRAGVPRIGREGRPGGRGDSEDRPLRLPRRRASAQAMKANRCVARRRLRARPGSVCDRADRPQATIVTVAGNGVDGHDGDGGRHERRRSITRGIAVLRTAASSSLSRSSVRPPSRRRRKDHDGRRHAAAGFSGDGPATSAQLNLVHGVALLPDGSMVLADTSNHRIRRVSPNGTITTVAGTGTFGFSGDGGPATAAQIAAPRASPRWRTAPSSSSRLGEPPGAAHLARGRDHDRCGDWNAGLLW